ncbi:MAG: ATP-binding protein [candidate division KSB1 bacterium]|nr:ATP-binding protein [candidate division KSB1 bacterium]
MESSSTSRRVSFEEVQRWISIEPIRAHKRAVRLRVHGPEAQQELGFALLKTIDACLKAGCQEVIVDLAELHFPSSSFIVALFEATAHSRRSGAELRLVNVQPTALNNFMCFSPLTYLRLERDESLLMEELGARPGQESTAVGLRQAEAGGPEQFELVNLDLPTTRPGENGLTPATESPGYAERSSIEIPSRAEEIYAVCDFVVGIAAKLGLDEREVGKIKISVYEACMNIVEHAYRSDPSGWIRATCSYDDTKLVIELEDAGEPFENWAIKPYDVEKAVQDRRTGGFGLHIIHRSMDEVHYYPGQPNGNLLRMVKYLEPKVV